MSIRTKLRISADSAVPIPIRRKREEAKAKPGSTDPICLIAQEAVREGELRWVRGEGTARSDLHRDLWVVARIVAGTLATEGRASLKRGALDPRPRFARFVTR